MLRSQNKYMGEWIIPERIASIIRTKVLPSCMIRHNLYNGKVCIRRTGRSNESHPYSLSHSKVTKLPLS